MTEPIPFSAERSAWPQQAAEQLQQCPADRLLAAVLEQRLNHLQRSEALLLAAWAMQQEGSRAALTLELLSGLQLRRCNPLAATLTMRQAQAEDTPLDPGVARAINLRTRQLALHQGVQQTLDPAILERGRNADPLEHLQAAQEVLLGNDISAKQALLNSWPSTLNSPEGLELHGRALRAAGHDQEAMAVLSDLLSRCSGSAAAWMAVLELNHLAGRPNGLAMATATRLHPRDAGIATHRVLVQLAERQPAEARRSAFRERLLYSLGRSCPSQHQSDANLLAAYDQTGRSDLTPWLHSALRQRLTQSPPLHANLCMQLASQASELYGPTAEAHAATFPARSLSRPRTTRRHLKVGLVSPDLYYHPVGRFVSMLLAAGFGSKGCLEVINTGRTAMPQLRERVQGHYHDLGPFSTDQRLLHVRGLELDVAIDLTGWTGDNNGALFASGIAPLQVNYLGYFASSGLEAMDLWIGDHTLFPPLIQEWHSEQIVRLDRPFLAWKPDQHLPEGRVSVPAAPSGPITFGCFNHVRKLSAATLRLWAELLRAIPNARLALKAFTTDDPGVIALLERRMSRCGLDPSAVIWLPTAPRPEDHLRQYGLIDLALDPFPNGGCTTTCEALWMGVPVITLRGQNYVSRMASAVLAGAGLPEWIAESEEHYLQLACNAAERLTEIRSNRSSLRHQLLDSPLGDSADLAEQLWSCLEHYA